MLEKSVLTHLPSLQVQGIQKRGREGEGGTGGGGGEIIDHGQFPYKVIIRKRMKAE